MSKDSKVGASSRNQKFFNRWRGLFQFLITHVFYMIRYKLVYRLEVIGRENIPEGKDYIVASNHLSTLDPPLMCAVLNRPIAYMAKKELFENIFMRWWLNWLGAFAVDRESLSVSTIRTVLTVNKTDWVFGIFPQGTRQAPGSISNVTKGFASVLIGFLGITNTSFVKINEYNGEKCILKETIMQKDKVGNKNLLNKFHGECCNNQYKCKYKINDKCKCKKKDIITIFDNLCEKGVFKKYSSGYKYQL